MFFVFRGFLLRPGIVRGSCGLATRCAQGSEARGLIGSRAKTSAAREHSKHKCTTMTLYCWGAGDPFTRTPTMTHNKDPNRWWIRRALAVGIERRKILETYFCFSISATRTREIHHLLGSLRRVIAGVLVKGPPGPQQYRVFVVQLCLAVWPRRAPLAAGMGWSRHQARWAPAVGAVRILSTIVLRAGARGSYRP